MKKIKTKMPMYKQINDDTLILSQQAIYGSSRLGVLERDEIVSIDSSLHPQTPTIPDPLTENVTHWSRGHKRYELTNHLGNVLATVSDRKLPVYVNNSFNYYKAEVMTANDYYAFGAQMPKREFDTSDYRFGFNGKVKDNEIAGTGNHLNYGDRGRDPRLGGGWWSPDPLAAKYPSLSPYHYAGNNPIIFVDYDGRDFGVKIDNDKHTIVVVANVYTTNKAAYEQALKSAGAWNEKSATVDGYTVTFQVKVMEASEPMSRESIIKANPSLVNHRGKVNETKLAMYQNKYSDNIAWVAASSDDIGNVYAGDKGYNSKNVSGESFVGGVTANGKHISMNTHDKLGDMGAFKDLVTHEFGHLMGLDDVGGTYYSNDGVMKYKGTSLNPISDNDVKDILNFAKDALGGKTKETDPKVKLIEQTGKSDGTNPIGVKNE